MSIYTGYSSDLQELLLITESIPPAGHINHRTVEKEIIKKVTKGKE